MSKGEKKGSVVMRIFAVLIFAWLCACSPSSVGTEDASGAAVLTGGSEAAPDLGGISTGNPESDGGIITGNPELTLPFPENFLPELPLPEESLIDELSEATDVLHPYEDGVSGGDGEAGSHEVGSRDFFTAVKMPSRNYAAVLAQFNAAFQIVKAATPEVTEDAQSVDVSSELPVTSAPYRVEHALVSGYDDTARFLFKDTSDGSVFGSAKIKIGSERFVKGHVILVSRASDVGACESSQLFGCLNFFEMAFDAEDDGNVGYVIRYQLDSRRESGHLHLQCDKNASACVSETPLVDAHPSELALADDIFRTYAVIGEALSFCAERVSYDGGAVSLSGIVFANDDSCSVPTPAWGGHVYDVSELPLRIGDDDSAPNGEKSAYESLSEESWDATTDLSLVPGRLNASGF